MKILTSCADEYTPLVYLPKYVFNEIKCNTIYLFVTGKTTWARQYAAAHPEKKFEIINAAVFLEKATCEGESRKTHTDVGSMHKYSKNVLFPHFFRPLTPYIRVFSQLFFSPNLPKTHILPHPHPQVKTPSPCTDCTSTSTSLPPRGGGKMKNIHPCKEK